MLDQVIAFPFFPLGNHLAKSVYALVRMPACKIPIKNLVIIVSIGLRSRVKGVIAVRIPRKESNLRIIVEFRKKKKYLIIKQHSQQVACRHTFHSIYQQEVGTQSNLNNLEFFINKILKFKNLKRLILP